MEKGLEYLLKMTMGTLDVSRVEAAKILLEATKRRIAVNNKPNDKLMEQRLLSFLDTHKED